MSRTVIVGSSVGAVRTAQALRREGFSGAVTILGAEPHLPYDKPPLSKQFLSRSWDLGRFTLLSAAEAATADIELRLGVAAAGLDIGAKTIALEDGSELAYDTLVIATGASARPSPWRAESGIHVLRSLDDSRAIQADLDSGGPVLVIGAGFIGSEVASTARGLGLETIMVDPAVEPMERIVGPHVAQHFSELHRRHGVRTHFGVGIESITGAAGRLAATLTDGTTIHAATAVVGIGATPNVAWLAGSGIELDDGIVCGPSGRVQACPDVYAVGDVACWRGDDGRSSRLEHWTNATEQAAHVARQIAGTDTDTAAFEATTFVWSDQHDWKIQVIGRPDRGSFERVEGELAADRTRAAVVYSDNGGALAGAVTINWARMSTAARKVLADRGRSDDLRA